MKQGNMSISEYRDKFIQLSRYAPEEVAEDERKQEHFIEGLNGPLQYALVAHTFPSFQRLLDKALAIEHKRWDSYVAAHDATDTITWAEFTTQFRNYHIPARLMKIKKKEFL